MGSGLIYAVIVVLWAVVLVPMWLRRHDHETESRSVDRFSNAMGILSRRSDRGVADTSADEADLERDGEPLSTAAPVSAADLAPHITKIGLGPHLTRPVREEPEVFVSRPRSAQRRSVQSARMRRRRRVLVTMGLLLVATGLGAAWGVVGLWAPAASMVLASAYVVMLRQIAVRESSAQRESLRRSGRRASTPLPRSASTPVTPTSEITAAAVASSTRVDEALEVGDRSTRRADWRPGAVPLPTYVTAPAATTVPRVIDRSADAGWTAARMIEHVEASRAGSALDAAALDATPDAGDVWSEATAADRDAVFDREWFEVDALGASAELDAVAETEVDDILGRGYGDDYRQRRASGA